MRKISDSTVRRLSVYLRFLEQAKAPTISSGELARLGGTTSAQVRKDLSFFGSFGKRGPRVAPPHPGYPRAGARLPGGAGGGGADGRSARPIPRLSPARLSHHRDLRPGRAQNRVALERPRRARRQTSRIRPQERSERHRHRRNARRGGATSRRPLGAERREGDPQLCTSPPERSSGCRSENRQYGTRIGDAELLSG